MAFHMRPEIKSKPVGECIYCGTTEGLQDEHIIAYAFNGNLVLSQASCAVCGAKTGGIEQHLCDTIFQSIRVHQEFKTRGKRGRISSLFVSREGKPDTIPVDEHPGILTLPVLAPQTYPKRNVDCMSISGVPAWLTAEDADKRLIALPSGTDLSARFKPDRFGRVLAKIAHSYAVAHLGIGGFTPFLRDIILDKDDSIGMYIGGEGFLRPLPKIENLLHALQMDRYSDEDGNEIVYCRIRLFSNFDHTPVYVAVVGLLTGGWPSEPRLFRPEDLAQVRDQTPA